MFQHHVAPLFMLNEHLGWRLPTCLKEMQTLVCMTTTVYLMLNWLLPHPGLQPHMPKTTSLCLQWWRNIVSIQMSHQSKQTTLALHMRKTPWYTYLMFNQLLSCPGPQMNIETLRTSHWSMRIKLVLHMGKNLSYPNQQQTERKAMWLSWQHLQG